ncbi:MAG: hypothetical protein ACXABY_15970 [Candidatus Thorarchaeota archaeon]|jgi:hypothetical protein
MAKDTRINVHLHEWKSILEDFFVEQHGDISRIIRELVQKFCKGELMFIDEKVHELLDMEEEESFTEAVALLTSQLQPLRDRRLRVVDAVNKRRTTAKKNKGLKKAGVQTVEEREAAEFHEKMKQRYKDKQKGGEASGENR